MITTSHASRMVASIGIMAKKCESDVMNTISTETRKRKRHDAHLDAKICQDTLHEWNIGEKRDCEPQSPKCVVVPALGWRAYNLKSFDTVHFGNSVCHSYNTMICQEFRPAVQ